MTRSTAATALLQDLFGRVAEALPPLLDGLDGDALRWQPDPAANPMGWLAWHIGRCEDAQIAHLAGGTQVWTAGGWAGRLGVASGARDVGYGHTPEQVRAFGVEHPAQVAAYYAAVHERTRDVVDGLAEDDLARVLDTRWDPPVTVGVRLVSIVNDVTQHLGQLAYVRGLWERAPR